MEAMDVLQEQVAGYENEIRILNTMKSPKRAGSGKPDKRRQSLEPKNLGAIGKRQQSVANLGNDASSMAAVGVLEAALFRPALSGALKEAAKWKNATLSKTLMELPPLSIPGSSPGEETKEDSHGDAFQNLSQLSAAMSAFRLEQASIRVVDLSKTDVRPRTQLRASKAARAKAAENLDSAAESARRYLAQCGAPASFEIDNKALLGKLRLQGKEPYETLTSTVTRDDLMRMNLHVVH